MEPNQQHCCMVTRTTLYHNGRYIERIPLLNCKWVEVQTVPPDTYQGHPPPQPPPLYWTRQPQQEFGQPLPQALHQAHPQALHQAHPQALHQPHPQAFHPQHPQSFHQPHQQAFHPQHPQGFHPQDYQGSPLNYQDQPPLQPPEVYHNSNPQTSEKPDEAKKDAGKKKKGPESWTRSDKQGFTHPWLLTSLKGHSSQVLDMDFASNGKYLASSAEEDLDPGGNSSSSSSSSDSNSSSTPPSSSSPSPTSKGLSRRQRKNRRRDDHSPSSDSSKKNKGKRVDLLPPMRKSFTHVPLVEYVKLNVEDHASASFLRSYLLSPEQMLTMGYPMASCSNSGRAVIFKSPIYTRPSTQCAKVNVRQSTFDVNAQEFVPGIDYNEIRVEWNNGHDSGQGSGSSSESGDSEGSDLLDKQFYSDQNEVASSKPSDTRKCVRCGQVFLVNSDGDYLTQENCVYHWSKIEHVVSSCGKETEDKLYSCCKGQPDSLGCTTGKCHVWNGLQDGFNEPMDLFVHTKPRRARRPDGNYGVYGLDCEMLYTSAGLEVAKVTVVGLDGRLVYDTFVKPEREILDYNTRFSGITAKDLKNTTKTLKDVQNDLMGFINADTVLVGHGLENDLRALRIIHYTVVDTAVAFPHRYGLPFRRSLKSLVNNFLKREIQGGSGHSSFEDARACMDLMLWRIHVDFHAIIRFPYNT